MYTIIEDASPFYIRFTFDGLKKVINFILKQQIDPKNCKSYFGIHNNLGYTHRNFSPNIGQDIIKLLPMSNLFDFKIGRVAIFDTPPNGGCGIHKDGIADKIGLNITLEINDDKCITKWYSDSQFINPNPSNIYSRNVYQDFTNLDQFNCIKTLVACNHEMILFNTDIYHSWQNKSECSRKVLTLKTVDSISLTYDEAKSRLFGI
jgi:hypothetical protein